MIHRLPHCVVDEHILCQFAVIREGSGAFDARTTWITRSSALASWVFPTACGDRRGRQGTSGASAAHQWLVATQIVRRRTPDQRPANGTCKAAPQTSLSSDRPSGDSRVASGERIVHGSDSRSDRRDRTVLPFAARRMADRIRWTTTQKTVLVKSDGTMLTLRASSKSKCVAINDSAPLALARGRPESAGPRDRPDACPARGKRTGRPAPRARAPSRCPRASSTRR